MKSIKFPPSSIAGVQEEIETTTSIVVIGPNGSGKTRLGSWIEGKIDPELVYRISAQKSLTIPSSVTTTTIDQAKAYLYYGHYSDTLKNSAGYKNPIRWANNPETSPLSDFDKLLTYLFSEHNQIAINYHAQARLTNDRVQPDKSKLNVLIEIWEAILPHRKLIIASAEIKTKTVDGVDQEYHSSHMSDGERVIFYLVGQALSAPENCTLIIDEPELHLHKSILRRLWDQIEQARPDCLFIYLTHDLEFVSTRKASTMICLRSFDGEQFNWFPIPTTENIPAEVYYEILGSRSPILFVEGDLNSYDKELYSLLYNDYTIKPMGSCTKVIDAVKSFTSLNVLHNLLCTGIVDRDYKTEDFVDSLKLDGIMCPNVAEIENLFLVEEVLLAVAKQLCVPNPDDLILKIKIWVIEQFSQFKEKYALESASAYINYRLNSFNGTSRTIVELNDNLNDFISNLNISDYYDRKLNEAEVVINDKNYPEVLRIFNHKGLVNQVGKFFDIKPSSYTKKVREIVLSGNVEVLQAMKEYMPRIN